MAEQPQQDALDTRERIVLAAIDVFYERGVSTTSLADIARQAGVSADAMHGHFEGKTDLFMAICHRIRLPMEALLDARLDNRAGDPLAQLRNAWLFLFRMVASDREWQRILAILLHRYERLESSDLLQRMRQAHANSLNEAARLLRRAVKQGQLPADLAIEPAAALLHASLSGVLSSWLLDTAAYDLGERAEAYVDSLLEIIRQAPPLRLKVPAALGEQAP